MVIITASLEEERKLEANERAKKAKLTGTGRKGVLGETCEYCGSPLAPGRRKRTKFCSTNCRRRASHNRATIRLDMPPTKRFKKRLMFSNPLYFN